MDWYLVDFVFCFFSVLGFLFLELLGGLETSPYMFLTIFVVVGFWKINNKLSTTTNDFSPIFLKTRQTTSSWLPKKEKNKSPRHMGLGCEAQMPDFVF